QPTRSRCEAPAHLSRDRRLHRVRVNLAMFMRPRFSFGLIALACVGCLGTPRVQDAPAIQDYVRQAHPPPNECHPNVPIHRSPPIDESDYVVVATLSATCYPGAPAVCERSLVERACKLGADILVVVETAAGGTPTGASGQSLSSMSARAMQRK